MVKVGLIGLGFMGGTHAAAYESLVSLLNFKVAAVADLDTEKASKIAAKFGAKVFKTGEELIASGEVDTVDICLPTYLHAPHILMAMKKGLNVLSEKPVCRKEEEAQELLNVQAETGANVMVAHCIRFWDEYVFLKKLLDTKEYGKLVSAVFTRVSPTPTWSWQSWVLNYEKSGTAVLDLHIHDIDYVRYILGEPDSIKADITYAGDSTNHIYTNWKYGDAIVSIEGGWDYPSTFPFEMAYRVKFEKATVTFSSAKNPSVSIYTDDDKTIIPEIKPEFSANSENLGGNISSLGGYFNEIKYFLDHVIAGKKIDNATLTDAVKSYRLYNREMEAAAK